MKPEYKKTKYVTPDWSRVQNHSLTKGKTYRIREWISIQSFQIQDDFHRVYIGSTQCWRSVDFEENLKKILRDG